MSTGFYHGGDNNVRGVLAAILGLDWITWTSEAEFLKAFNITKDLLDAMPERYEIWETSGIRSVFQQ